MAMAGPFASVRRRQMSEKRDRLERATRQSRNSLYGNEKLRYSGARSWGNSEKGMFKAGVEVLSVLHDVVRQDFKDHPIDSVPWMNAAVFGATFYLAGTPGWKSLLVGAIVLTASKKHYGRRTLTRAGVVLLVIGLPIWAGLLPPPTKWLDTMHSVMADMRLI